MTNKEKLGPGPMLRVDKEDRTPRITHLFPPRKVYLAGPITGLSYDDARYGWRGDFQKLLPDHIHCHSPMRAKDFLLDQHCLVGDPTMYPDHAIATPSGIVTRDRNDIRRECDAVVANFLGATKASIGTAIEFGWADAYGIPIVMVIEEGGKIATGVDVYEGDNPHWHAMLTELAGYRVPTLEEAAHIVTHLLTPGV